MESADRKSGLNRDNSGGDHLALKPTLHKELILGGGAHPGKHMFAEKAALDLPVLTAKQMAEAIEKAGLLFTTGYFMRTDPKHLYLKDQIAQGHFGKIGTRVRSSELPQWFFGRLVRQGLSLDGRSETIGSGRLWRFGHA